MTHQSTRVALRTYKNPLITRRRMKNTRGGLHPKRSNSRKEIVSTMHIEHPKKTYLGRFQSAYNPVELLLI